MEAIDQIFLSTLIVFAAILAWNAAQIRSLNRRLTSLEKEHLALVQQLEERIYPG